MYNNILIDDLPQKTPNGNKIRTNFRNLIQYELLMQDTTIQNEEKVKLALNLLFIDNIKNIEEAIDDILWLYSCGRYKNIQEVINDNKKNNTKNKNKQIYSYEFDDRYIYSAFLTQYNVDLADIKYMHWWKFKAMFEGLNDNNKLVQIMGYRSIDLSKIKDKKEKERIQELKNIYALPDMRTREEKESDFGKAFW